LKRIDNEEVGNAQWIYIGGENNEYVYTLGGPSSNITLAKYKSDTLKLLQQTFLDPSLYIGGVLLHENGNVYAVHGNKLYAYWGGNLDNFTKVTLPTDLNGRLVQTNGMVITHDGFLVIKQWAMFSEDLAMLTVKFPVIIKAVAAIYVVFVTIAILTSDRKSLSATGVVLRVFRSLLYCTLLLLSLTTLTFYKLANGPYDPWRLFTTNTFLSSEGIGGGGELKLINPITLQTHASLKLTERCSFARMALSTLPNGEDAMVLLGDEFSHQYRWNAATSTLYEVPNWSKRYRSRHEGSFPGTGPSIYNNTVYYTDNTFPIYLSGHTYSLFSQPLDSSSEAAYKTVHLTPPGSPGFMFWSVTVSPVVGDVIVWDTHGNSVQSRRAHDLSLHWEVKAVQMDCITVAADKGHVYFSDYSGEGVRLGDINDWIPLMATIPNVTKYLIVADAESGRILVNASIFEGTGMKPSLVVPGPNNDVLVGTPAGIARFYVDDE
jgi:hypothetical protein